MAKDEEKDNKNQNDPDEDFFKSHGVDADEDKAYLKSAYLREEYLAHRRKLNEDAEKNKGKGKRGGRLFGARE